MQTIAAAIGKEQGNPTADYRTVIRELKKNSSSAMPSFRTPPRLLRKSVMEGFVP